MDKKCSLLFNTVLMSSASIIMSIIAMVFQVWLAERIGAAGIGLYQLVLSVSCLCSTLAVSGIRFASTRLISEELGENRSWGVSAAMGRCFAYSAFFGIGSCALLFYFAEPIGFLWIGDGRTVLSLKIMAFAMPIISFNSVMSGYFTACGRVWKSTAVHISEQLITVVLVAVFLMHGRSGGIEASCACIMMGTVTADICSFIMMLCFFISDIGRYGRKSAESSLSSRMLRIALPLAFSAYARTALSTLEHLLVPRGLRHSGCSSDHALAAYGTVHGMVFPIISFPACILSAAAELTVPLLTEKQVKGRTEEISAAAVKLLRCGFIYSLAVAAVLFVFAEKLSLAIYNSFDAGRYIRLLSPLIPVMYTDLLIDGCLKGLGQQLWNMGINILDALLGVLMVYFLVPWGAMKVYIAIIYFNECLNFALSALRLKKLLRFT